LAFGAGFHGDEINTHPGVYDNGSFSFTGSETGSDLADFLLGIDSSYTQGHGQYFYNRNHYLGIYAQDKWDVTSKLTVSYGLRYDVLPPWSEKYNQLLTLDPNEQSVVFPNAPKGILFPGDPGVPKTLDAGDWDGGAGRVWAVLHGVRGLVGGDYERESAVWVYRYERGADAVRPAVCDGGDGCECGAEIPVAGCGLWGFCCAPE
jgi:hypothetical protein